MNNFVIPSMGGGALGSIFEQYAYQSFDKTAIVELGTWLGAGTMSLIRGVERSKKNIEVHSYDNFVIRGNEVDKARVFGVELKDGMDSLPIVKKYLSGYKVKLFLHKGEITNSKWDGLPISVYIDDACKYENTFIPALKIFSPFWIPGKTIIVLMDFYFYLQRTHDKGLEFQMRFIKAQKKCFEHIISYKKLCTAIFKYKGGLTL